MESRSIASNYKKIIANILERSSRYNYIFLLLPPLIYISAFFAIPLIWTIRISFYPGGAFTYKPGFTFSHYLRYLSDPYYLRVSLYTLKLTAMVVPFVLICSYFVAYLIATSSQRKATLYLILLAVPMFTTEVIRALGWQIMLSQHGVINNLLLRLGLINKPLHLIYCDRAIVIALIHSIIPYATLILIGVIVGIKRSYIEAARVFGANRLKAFYHVTLPLSMPGISGALVIAFMWCMGAYAIPSFLGSGAQRTMTMVIEDQILSVFNWPFGDAIAGILVIITLFCLIIYFKFSEAKETQ